MNELFDFSILESKLQAMQSTIDSQGERIDRLLEENKKLRDGLTTLIGRVKSYVFISHEPVHVWQVVIETAKELFSVKGEYLTDWEEEIGLRPSDGRKERMHVKSKELRDKELTEKRHGRVVRNMCCYFMVDQLRGLGFRLRDAEVASQMKNLSQYQHKFVQEGLNDVQYRRMYGKLVEIVEKKLYHEQRDRCTDIVSPCSPTGDTDNN